MAKLTIEDVSDLNVPCHDGMRSCDAISYGAAMASASYYHRTGDYLAALAYACDAWTWARALDDTARGAKVMILLADCEARLQSVGLVAPNGGSASPHRHK